jgi:hypothetical protein
LDQKPSHENPPIKSNKEYCFCPNTGYESVGEDEEKEDFPKGVTLVKFGFPHHKDQPESPCLKKKKRYEGMLEGKQQLSEGPEIDKTRRGDIEPPLFKDSKDSEHDRQVQ